MKRKFRVIICDAAVLILIAVLTYYSNINLTAEEKKTLADDLTENSIMTDCYEDDTIIECTITNNSKKDAKRVHIVYYVYNDNNECVYQVGDILECYVFAYETTK